MLAIRDLNAGANQAREPLLFEILQLFLGGGVAEVSSAAIPARGLSWVVRSTANAGPAEESWVEGCA